MLETAQVLWGLAVLILLIYIYQSNRETAAGLRRVHDRLVEQMFFLLFHTPEPTKAEQRRRISGFMHYLHFADFDELSDRTRQREMTDGHPVVLFVWDVARSAYRDAQESALSFGKFGELSQEQQDKVRDTFWDFFEASLELSLPGKAWLFDVPQERDESEWRSGDIPTKAGDVLLEATGLNSGLLATAYHVRLVETDGAQTGRSAGGFRSRSGAQAVAVRLGDRTRIIERRRDGRWVVTWTSSDHPWTDG